MAKKNNKETLKEVSYSIDIIKRIKNNEILTQEEKTELANKFAGMSKDNNSYFTPYEICKLITDILDIKPNSKVADLSAGIGNMIRPLISDSKTLRDNINADLYEYDENNSMVGNCIWEDYQCVNFYQNVNTLSLDIKPQYDYVLGNPPFTGSAEYQAEWNIDKKGKPKTKNDIVNSFIDMSFKVCNDNGYVALILPMGITFRGNATEKLRNYLTQYDLKFAIELDKTIFENSGLSGTSIGTVLFIWQKCKTKDNKTLVFELNPKDDLMTQLKCIPKLYKDIQKEHYIEYSCNGSYGYCGNIVLGKGEIPIEEEIEITQEIIDNDELLYLEHKETLTDKEKKHLQKLRTIRNREKELAKDLYKPKNIYICTSKERQDTIDDMAQVSFMNMIKKYYSDDNSNIVKILPRYGDLQTFDLSHKVVKGNKFDKLLFTVKGFKVERYRSRANKNEKWEEHTKHIYNGFIECSEEFYNVPFSIIHYVDENRVSCGVSYTFICSMSKPFSDLVYEVAKEMLGNVERNNW